MKIAPIIRALRTQSEVGGPLRYRLIHTGQHYDARMSSDFFTQLKIPMPDINLEVGSGSHAEQTSRIMTRYEKALQDNPSNLCLVVGDVTSTMAAAITAQKLCVPVAHVEGGIRSGDWTMPEEINRMVTDSISNWFFTTSAAANNNLRRSGVKEGRIFFVGNTMIDTLLDSLDYLQEPTFQVELNLTPGRYLVLTLHRPNNVDHGDQLIRILREVTGNVFGLPVVFPVHPRTATRLSEISTLPTNLHLVEPQPYLEFIWLVKNAKAVVTDSGGITEEATVLDIPCLTLRDTTERPETIEVGTNVLIGTNPDNLKPSLERLFAGRWKQGGIPELWDGHAGERIVEVLQRLLSKIDCGGRCNRRVKGHSY